MSHKTAQPSYIRFRSFRRCNSYPHSRLHDEKWRCHGKNANEHGWEEGRLTCPTEAHDRQQQGCKDDADSVMGDPADYALAANRCCFSDTVMYEATTWNMA